MSDSLKKLSCFHHAFNSFSLLFPIVLYAHERIAQITLRSVALYNRATGAIRSWKRANSSFALSLTKNKWFAQKTKERISNSDIKPRELSRSRSRSEWLGETHVLIIEHRSPSTMQTQWWQIQRLQGISLQWVLLFSHWSDPYLHGKHHNTCLSSWPQSRGRWCLPLSVQGSIDDLYVH